MQTNTTNTRTIAARFLDALAAWDATGDEPLSSRVSYEAGKRLDEASAKFLMTIPGVARVDKVGSSAGSNYFDLSRPDGAYVAVRVSNHAATGSQRTRCAWSFEVEDSIDSVVRGIAAVAEALAAEDAE